MEEQLQNIWVKSLFLLESELSALQFKTWIATLTPIQMNDSIFVLKAQHSIAKEIVEGRYISLIVNCISQVINKECEVIVIEGDEIPIKKSNSSAETTDVQNNLNPKYVFDTFVVGNSNRLAHAAALAVAEAPAKAYNPLFLYGGVGLGKTHLMHSIGHYISKQKSSAKVLYVSSEKFTNELIDSIQYKKNEEFRNKYRKIDVLLIDDIQFISEKVGTQEEFFHTFNTLYEANKQIIISSDRPPKEIKHLEARLQSRFEQGLITDIQTPDYETRVAILKKKAETDKIQVPVAVLEFIAKSIKSNIRTLEGALTKVAAYSMLTNKQITLTSAEESIKDLLNPELTREINADLIQEVVANFYNIRMEDLTSKKRMQSIAYPRQVAMYLCRKLTQEPLTKLGEKFGGRDHTTILHGSNKIETEAEKDSYLQKVLLDLESKIIGK